MHLAGPPPSARDLREHGEGECGRCALAGEAAGRRASRDGRGRHSHCWLVHARARQAAPAVLHLRRGASCSPFRFRCFNLTWDRTPSVYTTRGFPTSNRPKAGDGILGKQNLHWYWSGKKSYKRVKLVKILKNGFPRLLLLQKGIFREILLLHGSEIFGILLQKNA